MTVGRRRGLGSTVLLLAALAGCTQPGQGAAQAEAACGRVGPDGADLVAAYPTTVRHVRDRQLGPRTDASKAPFAGRPDGFAAWCWFERPEHHRFVVAALPTGERVTVVEGDPRALEPNPDGPAVP